jgi:hypothetical protein
VGPENGRSYACQENPVGGKREDRLHSSTTGIVYQECQHNRQDPGFKERFA